MFAQLGFAVLSPITIAFKNSDIDLVREILRAHSFKRLTILNDSDVLEDGRQPGLEGAKKMAAALADTIEVRIGRLPRAEGVAKVDVNELGAAAMARGGEEEATNVLRGLVTSAKSYVEFLIDDLNQNAPAEALDASIREIGKLSASTNHLVRSARVGLTVAGLGSSRSRASASSRNSFERFP